jgi:hypothetical protein
MSREQRDTVTSEYRELGVFDRVFRFPRSETRTGKASSEVDEVK